MGRVTPASRGPAGRILRWRPATPPLPDYLAPGVHPDDPEWFARELAIAAAPPWRVWTFLLRNFWWLVNGFGRLQVSGSIPHELRSGPLLLAVNHIGDFDPIVVTAALARLGLTPRILATAGIVDAPIGGPVLERCGLIRVERGTELARQAVHVTEVALVHGGHVVVYPEAASA